MAVQLIFRSTFMTFEMEFRQLNEAWISKYFIHEESDRLVLSNPQKYILDKGGNVFIAFQDGRVLGCCALLVHDLYTCELAKMVVDPSARGKGIGSLLGAALIEKARQRGFKRVVLEGNTKMAASIILYRKLGFQEVPFTEIEQKHELHARCNIFMELRLNPLPLYEYYI
ncbi:MAG: GNAT family N-acetyltransferase [Paludibacter sp.]|nr:GNAT family N-acetyltransferase [Paludibacter sp.]